jgi:tripartite-type tricarboxylate transporter receptor subunit TctC
MTITRRLFGRGTAALTTLSAMGLANAQSALVERATIFVGFPAGGGTDGSARRVGEGMRGTYARNVLVENKPGATGRLAVEEVRRGATDGSVMIMQPDAVMVNQPQIDPKNIKYKFEDLSPVVSIGLHDHALAVGPMVPDSVRTMSQFLEWAKANPKLASYGTPGSNSVPDFLMKAGMKDNSFELVHVPYKGSAPGMQDLLSGQVAAMVSPVGDSLSYRASGKVRVLGTSGRRRSKFTPDVPTFAEQGFKGMELTERMGLWMNRSVPEPVMDRLHSDVQKVLLQPEVIEFLSKIGFEEDPISRLDFAKATRESYQAWGERIIKTGYKPEE